MVFRRLAAGSFSFGLILLGLAGFGYVIPADRPGAFIHTTHCELPAVAAGQAIEVAFQIHNRTGSTVRVVGLAEC
jgi:hypothetical protein